jgi:hypothetical protein
MQPFSAFLKSLKECSNQADANATESIYKKEFISLIMSPQMFGCPLPCKRISYGLDVSYYHNNSYHSDNRKHNFILYIYPSLDLDIIEDQVNIYYSALYTITHLVCWSWVVIIMLKSNKYK